ncbi:MAG: M48 family metalloprotease, partial [Gemmataceae bacterium]|nr:M48 family metalloprotease [Gemmataceae bacterium]
MPILVIFLVTAACLPVEWPAPPLGLGAGASAGLTAAAVLLPLLAAFAVRTRVVRAVAADPSRLAEAGRRYSRARRMLFFVNLGAVVLAVVGLGWGWTVRHALRVNWNGSEVLAPFADLAVPLPYFLLAFGTWLVYYDAEGALHRGPRFPPRAAYFVHNLRQLALLVGLPVGLFAGQQTVARFFPETARADVYRAAAVAVVPVLILVLPLLVKPLLGLKPLPPGPVRDRLEALARRLRFRSAGLLVWPTHGHGANALILGLVPRVRYVVFTDALLDALPDDERDAVFGHEVGHARHGHVWYYAVFLALSMAVLAAGLLLGMRELAAAADADPGAWYTPVLTDEVGWTAFLPVVLAAGYVFLVFGFVSRRCERQADVFGCRAVSCGNPRCDGHDEATVYPPGGAAAG